jgi:N6-adenosine-specific RNA methylase IME4
MRGLTLAAPAPFETLKAGHYGAILADPPWAFKTWGGENMAPHRSANDPYRTAPMETLKTLPVARLAAPDSVLLLWVVDSHFPEAIGLARAWGFAFKTCAFVWAKGRDLGHVKIGMGYWTRKQTEQCWLFTRGKPRCQSHAVRQLLVEPRREHSRKPDGIYGRIEHLVAGPYCELFARTTRPGWDSWGDEVGKFAARNTCPQAAAASAPRGSAR